jgi:predicted DCC family thiol-disulfide oxidoreductase YuxK
VTARGPDHALVLFDGICNLCNGFVNFLIDRDPQKKFRFGALQSVQAEKILSAYGRNKLSDSIVLVDHGKLLKKSRAILEIAWILGGFWRIFYVFKIIPPPALDFLYDMVAATRYKIFGRREQCRVPTNDLMDRFLS